MGDNKFYMIEQLPKTKLNINEQGFNSNS